MKLKTQRFMTGSAVRSLCIKQDYFTCGNNEQYCNFLNDCNGVMSDSDILKRAEIIMKYSNVDRLISQYSCTEKEFLESICFNLIADACYTSVELVEA